MPGSQHIPSSPPLLVGRQENNGGTSDQANRPAHPRRTLLPEPPIQCRCWYWRSSAGELAPYHCNTWRCPECSPRMAARWAAIIAAAEPQRHIVLTQLGADAHSARSALRNITKAIRRGQALGVGSRRDRQIEHEYFATLESSASGHIHAHLLQRGASIPVRNLSRLACAYGAGRVAWIRSISITDRPLAVASYVAQHLVGTSHADQAKLGRRVRYSRDFWAGRTTAQVRAELWPRPDLDPDVTWSLIGIDHSADDGATRRRLADLKDLS